MIPWYIEILYIVITTVVVGYIFSGMFKHVYTSTKDVFEKYQIFNWEDVKWGIIIAAPGIVLHELAHKFTAMAFGLTAYYQIFWEGLGLGVLLKLLNTGFIILAPGYVVISGASDIQSAITAFAGPCINLILWLGCYFTLKYHKNLSKKTSLILLMTQEINKWLFIFNMIPIPPLDGSKVFAPLINWLF